MVNEKRLIDANALRTDTMVMCGVNEAVLENCYPYWQFNKAIVNAPTVDAVEVVHGRWKPVYTCSGEWLWGYNCDRCKLDSPTQSKYCPNCGAKMDGDGNG